MNEKIEKLKFELERDEAKLADYLSKVDRLKQRISLKHKKLNEIEGAVFLEYIRENNISLEQLMSLKKDNKSDSETVLQQDFETETAETDTDYFSEGSLFDFSVPEDDYGENEDN